MPTKTPTKKAAPKKVAVAKKATTATKGSTGETYKVKVVREVPASTVNELFSTKKDEGIVEVPQGAVALYVNGKPMGNERLSNETILEFVTKRAQQAGIRTFSVYVDGRKVDTADGSKKLAGAAKVEIVAKDARGSRGSS